MAQQHNLNDIWDTFAARHGLITYEKMTHQKDEDEVLTAIINHGTSLAAFDSEGHLEDALADYGLSQVDIGIAQGDRIPITVKRSS